MLRIENVSILFDGAKLRKDVKYEYSIRYIKLICICKCCYYLV